MAMVDWGFARAHPAARRYEELSAVELEALLWYCPFEFGNFVATPKEWKDCALRLWTARRIVELERPGERRTRKQSRELKNLRHTSDGLVAAERQADAAALHAQRKRIYLYELHPTQFGWTGQAVVAIGDVDSAPIVPAYVGGVGTRLETLSEKTENALISVEVTERMNPGVTAAGFALLDYRAPQSRRTTLVLRFAKTGARRLERFVATYGALRAYRHARDETPPPSVKVLGHSYGGVVLGYALKRLQRYGAVKGLFVAAPGMGSVRTVAELDLVPGAVAAVGSSEDSVTYFGTMFPGKPGVWRLGALGANPLADPDVPRLPAEVIRPPHAG